MRDSTPVITEEGVKAIADLTAQDRVLSWNERDQLFQLSPTSGAFPKGKENLYRICTPRGEFIASEEHLTLTSSQRYKPLNRLTIGDKIKLAYTDAEETSILAIERQPDSEWYFDQHVFGTNNYVTQDGAIHHNSGKSQAGTFRIAKLMISDPGINCAYYFPTYDLINLRGIPGMVSDLEVLGVRDYSINKSDFSIKVAGHGVVIFRSYDRPERIVAYEVAHSVVDELDTLPRDKAEFVWRKVVERNRQPCHAPMGNTVACVTTPDQGIRQQIWRCFLSAVS